MICTPEPHIRRGNRDSLGIIVNRDNLGIIIHISLLKHTGSLRPPLETSHRDGSNEGSQHMFYLRNKKIVFELPSITPLIWTSVHVQ